ncbi:MAG: response regulator [Bacteroidales bacterium]|jgi:CheY-like chemotaxis protein/CRP-like cAMP-binding protein|nr:response regulator [Bacteroidales bacterium]
MKKILVIEDDRIMRENMAELLELVGYDVAIAKEGKEGVEKAQNLLPDLIICDIKMPVLDGYGVLHILSKNPETSGIPFIFVTAKTERKDLRKGMEMGADDYLTKPFEDTELLKAVETRLSKSAIVKKDYSNNAEGIHEFINEANILVSLKKASKKKELQVYESKELICKAGDYPRFIFFIESGRVKTYRMNADGKELISNTYEAGDFFGYQPVLEERTYDESAMALESSKVLKILKEDFLSLIYKNRDVAHKLIKIISKNLSQKEDELIHMAYDSVRKRVAIKLRELIPLEGDNTVTISRTDLAAMVGTTTETLVRTLSELKDLDIIDTDTHNIILLDRKKLDELSRSW